MFRWSIAGLLSVALALCAEPPKLRLPGDVKPLSYELDLNLDPSQKGYTGSVVIDIEVIKPVRTIWINSTELRIDSARVGTLTAKIEEGGPDFAGLTVEAPLRVGKSKLSLSFAGVLNPKDVEGLFKQTEGGDSYIFTQFEPTSARRAFPCFDEPQFKVPWTVTVHAPQNVKVFANTPQVSERMESGGTKTVRFAKSKPMPTYLVALAIGPFDVVDGGTAGVKKTPLRILAMKGRGAEAAYATAMTPKIFKILEEYFGTPYPYEKLDQAAIPVTVAFGAMENAGLITYQQTLLLAKQKDDTITRQRQVTEVIAHELAHQWFGNMVTPAWWDDIWLNEAFASWIELKVLDALHPEWNTKLKLVGEKDDAMRKDSLLSSRKIRQEIVNHGDIGNAFDSITYRKGGGVIRMFEHWLGPKTFQAGVRAYMAKHAWGNATANDFLNAISSVAKRDVTRAFSTFLDRGGLPLIRVSLKCDGGKAKAVLSQERFLPMSSKGGRQAYWQVPVCLKYDGGSQCAFLTDPKDEIALDKAKGCPAWIYVGEDSTGYYRVRYEGELQQKLVENAGRLALSEKVELIKNTQALVSAGAIDADQALALAGTFAKEREREVVAAALQIVLGMQKIVPDALVPQYRKLIRDSFGARARELGWSPKPGESPDDSLLRRELVPEVALKGNDEELIAGAKALAEQWMKNRNAVDPAMTGGVLSVAAAYSGREFYDSLVRELKASKDRRERTYVIRAMAHFRQPEIAARVLSLMFDPDVDVREVLNWIVDFQEQRETEAIAWTFVTTNYDRLLQRLPSLLGTHAGSRLPLAGAFYCDEKGLKEVKDFFSERIKTISGGDLILAQVVERIELCGPLRQALRPGVVKFLEGI